LKTEPWSLKDNRRWTSICTIEAKEGKEELGTIPEEIIAKKNPRFSKRRKCSDLRSPANTNQDKQQKRQKGLHTSKSDCSTAKIEILRCAREKWVLFV
jgi:hypothetical protein